MAVILHLTTVHPRFDIRICEKEAHTLASSLPHTVILLVADGKGNVGGGKGQVSFHDIGCLKGGRLGRVIVGTWRAFFAVRRIKPEVVHFHDPELIMLGIALKVIGYKVIYDVHEDVPRQVASKYWIPLAMRKPIAWIMSVLEWCGAKVFDAIISATPKIAERFPANKTIVVQNFPFVDELLFSAFVPYIERPKSFAYVGGITAIRGAVEMVRAIDLVQGISCVRLDMAGNFSPYRLVDTLRRLPGWASVNYHGEVSRERVRHLLSSVRAGVVVLYPTPNYKDAYPTKMFEYMAAGLPVIASDFPLWRQIVDSAKCGLLVDPLDPQSIADSMRWILNHPEEAEAMGQRGKRAVKEIYNWNMEQAKLVNLYTKLLAP